MTRRRKRATAADVRAYAKAHPGLAAAEIARELGVSRQAARQALESGDRMGRPPSGRTRVTVRVRDHVLELARAEAERDGITVQGVLESAIEASLVPEQQWTQPPPSSTDTGP